MEKDAEKTAGNKANIKFKPNHFSLGVTIGRDQKVSEVEYYRAAGLDTFQLMVDFNKRGVIQPLPSGLSEALKGANIILHMPFYFHLLLERTPMRRKYFININNQFGKKSRKIKLIVHCKGIHQPISKTQPLIFSFLKYYASICPGLKICLENDAGGKTNIAPRIKTLASTISALKHGGVKNVGLCVDTQHAYAAGDELFSINLRQSANVIHLNAIPKFVEFGGHLDRHSETRLIDSKRGLNFAKKILGLVRPKTPIILERTNHEVVKSDISTLRRLIDVLTIEDVDKKNLGKTLPETGSSLHREGSHL